SNRRHEGPQVLTAPGHAAHDRPRLRGHPHLLHPGRARAQPRAERLRHLQAVLPGREHRLPHRRGRAAGEPLLLRAAQRPRRARYAVQALIGLLVLGSVAALAVYGLAGAVARGFSNPHLGRLAAPLALYTLGMAGGAPLELSLTTAKKTGWAGFLYVLSDIVRAAVLILPTKLGGALTLLAWCAAGFAGLRLLGAWTVVLGGAIGRPRMPTRAAALEQLRYSVPFGGAVILQTIQMQLPQFTVSALTDAATHALYPA